jgi:hypothetical protein
VIVLDWEGFSGQRRLIQHGRGVEYHSVDWNNLAGLYHKQISSTHVFDAAFGEIVAVKTVNETRRAS